MQNVHVRAEDGFAVPRVPATDLSGVDNSWFGRLATSYLRKRLRRAPAVPAAAGRTELERAAAAIRAACVKCAVSGAASGTLTTVAELVTAETAGLAAPATVPVAVGAVIGEMVFRAVVHLGLACDLSEIFGVPFDPEDPIAFLRLCALAFGTSPDAAGSRDRGRQLVERVLQPGDDDVGASIGYKLVGESILRNLVPFVAPVTSSIASWRMTRKLGGKVQSYMTYHRAFRDEALQIAQRCAPHFELLAEGLWFLFVADGELTAEETGVLAYVVRRLPASERPAVTARFVEDDNDWLRRLAELPAEARADFFHALEVAATVDKVVTLPERKILRNAARALGQEYDEGRILGMIKQFEEVGVLTTNRSRADAS